MILGRTVERNKFGFEPPLLHLREAIEKLPRLDIPARRNGADRGGVMWATVAQVGGDQEVERNALFETPLRPRLQTAFGRD